MFLAESDGFYTVLESERAHAARGHTRRTLRASVRAPRNPFVTVANLPELPESVEKLSGAPLHGNIFLLR